MTNDQSDTIDEHELTTKIINDSAFSFNTDWTGNVMIRVNGRRVDVPFADLIGFVVELARDTAIKEIEDMSSMDVLGNFGHMLITDVAALEEEGE